MTLTRKQMEVVGLARIHQALGLTGGCEVVKTVVPRREMVKTNLQKLLDGELEEVTL